MSLRPGKKTRQSVGKHATASLWFNNRHENGIRRKNRRTLQNLTFKTFSYDYKKDTQKGHKILAFFCLIAVVSNRVGTGRKAGKDKPGNGGELPVFNTEQTLEGEIREFLVS